MTVEHSKFALSRSAEYSDKYGTGSRRGIGRVGQTGCVHRRVGKGIT